MEAPLSGVGIVDDIPVVDYHRSFVPPDAWTEKRIFAIVDSADYESTMYVNDEARPVSTHRGGYTPFKGELTEALKYGEENNLYLHIVDDLQNNLQPRGKQAKKLHPHS
jgi:beta-glucuronidase